MRTPQVALGRYLDEGGEEGREDERRNVAPRPDTDNAIVVPCVVAWDDDADYFFEL